MLRLSEAAERLDPRKFIGVVGGQAVSLYRLQHANGMEVAICNLGAKVLQWRVPNRHGAKTDVVLGYDSLPGVLAGSPSMGAFIGRYAGRIGQARYTLDGIDYHLPANAGEHSIHGGPRGSRHRVFNVLQHSSDSLVLGLRFEPSLDGHPGVVDLTLTYRLTEEGTLVIEHEAVAPENQETSDVPSPVSFTPHLFFNLDGSEGASVDAHSLEVMADKILDCDADGVATGDCLSLAGHHLDLRQPRCLADMPDVDHAFELRSTQDLPEPRWAARVHSKVSGHSLSIHTTEPVLQVYTCAALGAGSNPDVGKQGRLHRPRMALCLEPQRYPNAMNCPPFPVLRVMPGQPYRARTEYYFNRTGTCP
ncbi:aldose epimerase family protein [Hydrogenophaga sp. 5NK40-0174]|uniref:aldose epimerase family protein n=1 Tax=Hydrogenophaga sp. 5NK40-0174 TaxID=3127649 RepID=UPI003108498E